MSKPQRNALLLGRLLEYRIDGIDRLREVTSDGIAYSVRLLKERGASLRDDEDSAEIIADQIGGTYAIQYALDEVCIVALHKGLEQSIRRAFMIRWPSAKPQIASKFERLSEWCKKHAGIDLALVRHSKWITELRVLSNAIKHTGEPTVALRRLPRWKRKKDFGDLGQEYKRLKVHVVPYVRGLALLLLKVKGTP